MKIVQYACCVCLLCMLVVYACCVCLLCNVSEYHIAYFVIIRNVLGYILAARSLEIGIDDFHLLYILKIPNLFFCKIQSGII